MASWTEKCVSKLKLLHEEGFSATVIAKKLGPDFTKGMVLGKLSRLALAEAPKPQETRKASVQRVIRRSEITTVADRAPEYAWPGPAGDGAQRRPVIRSAYRAVPVACR